MRRHMYVVRLHIGRVFSPWHRSLRTYFSFEPVSDGNRSDAGKIEIYQDLSLFLVEVLIRRYVFSPPQATLLCAGKLCLLYSQ
jgi:hypothetical protein